MSFIDNYKIAFRAENIKRKGTGTFLMAAIFGAFVPLVVFIFLFFQKEKQPVLIPFNHFEKSITDLSIGLSSFFLPLLIVLISAKITQIDHRNGGWQLMETLPISKLATYSSKLTILLISNLIAIVSFVVCFVLLSWILYGFGKIPEGVLMDIPWRFLLQFMARMFVATLFFTMLQFIISTVFSSFVVPILIGVALIIGTMIIRDLQIEKVWNPITILNQTAVNSHGSDLHHWLLYTERLSLVAFISLFIVGFIWFKSKTLRRIFTVKSNAIKVIVTLVIGLGIVIYLLTPNHLPKHHRTVIAGEFDTDEPISKLILSDRFMRDTIAEISVEGNRFHYVFSKEVPLKQYTMLMQMKEKFGMVNIPFRTNDNVYIKYKIANNNFIQTIKGNQLADLEYNSEGNFNLWQLENGADLYSLDEMVEVTYKTWKEIIHKTTDFRTKDNYALSEELSVLFKKVNTLVVLNYWRKFEEKVKHTNPEIVNHLPKEIQEIKDFISLTDHSLLTYPQYSEYVLNELVKKDTMDIPLQTKQLNAITKLNDPSFKDQLLFYVLNESLDTSFDSNERRELMQTYASQINNLKIKNRIYDIYTQGEKVARGNQSYDFEVENSDGTIVRMSDFKGKYVVIDVWATWCAPCLYAYPYFEKIAIKYRNNPNFVFVGLNVDSQEDVWLQHIHGKSKAVVQVRLLNKDIKAFKENYNITQYPKYILLDKEGKFISAQMPPPTEEHFEQMLKDLP